MAQSKAHPLPIGKELAGADLSKNVFSAKVRNNRLD